MMIGYTRVWRHDVQDTLELQLRELEHSGVKKLFSASGSAAEATAQLAAALQFCREGDTFVVTSLDRLADSVDGLCRIIGQLAGKTVEICVLDMNLDTRTDDGKAMLRVFAEIARFSKQGKYERQREGIDRARLQGQYKGRKPTARNRTPEVLGAYKSGRTIAQIVRDIGIGRASVYRILDANGLRPKKSREA